MIRERIRETLKDEMLDVVKPDLVLCGAATVSTRSSMRSWVRFRRSCYRLLPTATFWS